MDAGVLDVFHHAADDDRLAVGDRIDVHFDRALEIAIDQQRMLLGGEQRLLDVAAQARFVRDDFHRASAEHVGGPDQHRIADFRGAANRLGRDRAPAPRAAV